MGNISIVIGSWGSYNECNERALGSKWLDLSDYSIWDEIEEELKKDCKQMLKSLIKEIVLYDDKIEITYNYVDTKRIKIDDEHKPETFYTDEFETIIDEHKFNHTPQTLHIDIDAKV